MTRLADIEARLEDDLQFGRHVENAKMVRIYREDFDGLVEEVKRLYECLAASQEALRSEHERAEAAEWQAEHPVIHTTPGSATNQGGGRQT